MFATYCVIFLWSLIDLEIGGKDPLFGLPWAAWSWVEGRGGVSPFLLFPKTGRTRQSKWDSAPDTWEGREQHLQTPKWNLTPQRNPGKNAGLAVCLGIRTSLQRCIKNTTDNDKLYFSLISHKSSEFSPVYNQNYSSFCCPTIWFF